jgi:hypothetical protein
MPVKIITGTTNNKDGVINVDDLTKMKNDFITETELKATAGRVHAYKTYSCFLYREQVDNLFALIDGDPKIMKINFALHLNPTIECSDSDYSDKLTVVIEAAEDDPNRTVHNAIGEYVLIPAFSNKTVGKKINGGSPCCPSSNPFE